MNAGDRWFGGRDVSVRDRRSAGSRGLRVEALEQRVVLSSYSINLSTLTSSDGGKSVDLSYNFTGRPPSQPDMIVYWASSNNWGSRILDVDPSNPNGGGEAGYAQDTDAVAYNGSYKLNIALNKPRPAGANYLVVFPGPTNHTPGSFDKQGSLSNSLVVPAPSSAMTLNVADATWNATQGGVDFDYTIRSPGLTDGSPLPSGVKVPIGVYWASGPSLSNRIGSSIFPGSTDSAARTSPFHLHVDPSYLANPPKGAVDLIVALDPDHTITGATGSQNFLAIPFDPTIHQVTAKYDGHPSQGVIGRFFSIPGVSTIKNETFDVVVSNSLAAIRPNVAFAVGSNQLTSTYTTDTSGVSLGANESLFVSQQFDPGTLATTTPLVATVANGKGTSLDAKTDSIQVVAAPTWFTSLQNTTTSFDTTADGPYGSYVFQGLIPKALSTGPITVTSADVPYLGSQSITATLGVGFKVLAPLTPTHTPTVNGQPTLALTAFGHTVNVDPSPTVMYGSQPLVPISISFTKPLDPMTLKLTQGGGILLTGQVELAALSYQLASGSGIVGDLPALYNWDVSANIKAVAGLNIGINYSDASGFSLSPENTSFKLTEMGSIDGKVEAGWYLPVTGNSAIDQTMVNLKKRFGINPKAVVTGKIGGSISLSAQIANRGGSLGLVTSSIDAAVTANIGAKIQLTDPTPPASGNGPSTGGISVAIPDIQLANLFFPNGVFYHKSIP